MDRLVRTAVLVALVAAVVRGCALRPATAFPGAHFNRGDNAAWLDVDWVNQPKGPYEVRALAGELGRHQIRRAFVYVSYLKPGNAFNPTYAHAESFVRVLKVAAPGLRVEAWIGLPLDRPGLFGTRGYVDPADSATRAAIAAFCAEMVGRGFDGVHLDPEPAPNGDPALLTLLEQVRAAIGPSATLSTATPRIWPVLAEAPWPAVGPPTWRADYYRAVAARVDAIAVMTYDSGLPLAPLYRLWQRWEVIQVSRALEASGAAVYVGVPTSEEATFTHQPGAENMEAALLGLIEGLNDADARPEVITGAAIYPHWETDEQEWRTYDRLWTGQPG